MFRPMFRSDHFESAHPGTKLVGGVGVGQAGSAANLADLARHGKFIREVGKNRVSRINLPCLARSARSADSEFTYYLAVPGKISANLEEKREIHPSSSFFSETRFFAKILPGTARY